MLVDSCYHEEQVNLMNNKHGTCSTHARDRQSYFLHNTVSLDHIYPDSDANFLNPAIHLQLHPKIEVLGQSLNVPQNGGVLCHNFPASKIDVPKREILAL